MRAIVSIGRFGFDLEMRLMPKGEAAQHSDVEVHEIESDTDVAPHIIGFVPEEEEGDD